MLKLHTWYSSTTCFHTSPWFMDASPKTWVSMRKFLLIQQRKWKEWLRPNLLMLSLH